MLYVLNFAMFSDVKIANAIAQCEQFIQVDLHTQAGNHISVDSAKRNRKLKIQESHAVKVYL